ncbi:MAG: hypothetical protein ABI411_17840 [Tahibacter sp.]
MRTRFAALLALPMLLSGTAHGSDLQYTLDYSADGESMLVRVCSETPAAQRHFSLDRGAFVYLSGMQRSRGEAPRRDDEEWIAEDWRAGDCLSYRAALGQIADRCEGDVGYRIGKDLLTSPQQWLLHTRSREAADVQLTLPVGYSASVPWQVQVQPTGDTGPRHYRMPVTPTSWSSSIAIGRFSERALVVNNATVRVSILDEVSTATRRMLEDWIAEVAQVARSAYGALPVADVQVLLLPVVSGRSGAVGFGKSTRGQGNALMLLIDPSQSRAEFRADWTAVHEMGHLFHPYLGDAGRWLAEGLASYWQNVLRARAGWLSAPLAWQRLDAGFKRGREDAHSGTSLAELVDGRHGGNAFMRIYWGGAAYWLRVDSELRTRDPALSVDVALQRFRDCCMAERREWNPAEFVAKLDALLGVDTFTRNYRAAAVESTFPDLSDIYRNLGLVRGVDGLVQLDDHASGRAVRDAIMRRP